MNRRTFLKSIATVCGAAVVCPGELVKSPVQPKSGLEPGWYDIEILSEANRKKYRQNIIIKARQQGMSYDIPYGIPYYFRGVPIHYQENLSA